jgi:hypothetical protein
VVAGHFVPDLRHGTPVEIGQRAVVGLLGPIGDLAELLKFLLLGKHAGRALLGVLQPALAQVVPPPFHQNRRELDGHDAAEKGNVLLEKLLLETDGMRRDHDPAPRPVVRLGVGLGIGLGPGRGEDRRHEVGEALADPGPRLDDQMVPTGDRLGDRLGHGERLGAGLIVLQPGGNPPPRPEDFGRC